MSFRHHLPGKDKFSQGFFKPQNPEKYIGKYPIRYLSSWELRMMTILDQHPAILTWSSEPFSIPYFNPITKKKGTYIPDFLIAYMDRKGKKHVEIVEVKPSSQAQANPKTKSPRMLKMIAMNAMKWQAAAAYARLNRIGFRVITETDLFTGAHPR